MSKRAKINDDPAWFNMDMRTTIKNDLTAAVSVLQVVLDEPQIFDAVVKYYEDFRQKAIADRAKSKE